MSESNDFIRAAAPVHGYLWTRICAYCGTVFGTEYLQRKYCGDECAAAQARQEKHREKHLTRIFTTVCAREGCGNRFPLWEARSWGKRFCSTKCRTKNAYISSRTAGVCVMCGEKWSVGDVRKKYCSDKCRKKASRKNNPRADKG